MKWSADQYAKFEEERTRPVRDLLARIPTTDVATAVDLGCGPGNSSELLCQKYPAATVVGVDNSAEMLEAARRRLPDVRFQLADIANWPASGPFDVILANASLQWLPGHAELLPKLVAKLAPGGTLAIQIPDNLEEPAHRLMRQIAREGAWAEKLEGAGLSNANRHSAEWYYRELRPLAMGIDIWRTTYYHVLHGGAEAVVEWFKGTGLRPILDRLNENEQAKFSIRYREVMAEAYPAMDDGTVLLPFPRLFVLATTIQ